MLNEEKSRLLSGSFKEWLIKQEYKESTIKHYEENIKYIEKWTLENNYDLENLSYSDVMKYIENLRENISFGVIQKRIFTLKKYYEYLSEYGMPKRSFLNTIQLQDKRPFLGTILTENRLEKLYKSCQEKTKVGRFKESWRRTTILAGLLIFQGLEYSEVKRLEIRDIDFDSCEIYIKASERSNSRKLMLQTKQVMLMYKQLSEEQGYVFEEKKIQQYWHSMSKQIRKLDSSIKNMNQIRKSVIANWTEKYDLRTTQYMAGHKHVKSTERYRIVNVEKLKNQLENYHPLNG